MAIDEPANQARAEPFRPTVDPPRSGEVVAFAPKKRARGRPRKRPLIERRCTDGFEMIAQAVVAIASQRSWPAVKERVRSWADRDPDLTPSAVKVLGFLLEHINRKQGVDWHGRQHIAKSLGLDEYTVRDAFNLLDKCGYSRREYKIVPVKHRSKVWQTTIPKLVDAAQAVAADKAARVSNEGVKNPQRRGKKPFNEGVK